MAKIKLNIASAISGKLGGNIYSRNKGGAYVKQWVSPINPNTPAQSLTRQRFSDLSNDWKGLTQTQRDTWNSAAPNFPIKDRLGETIVLSGQQLYMKFNRNLQSAGLSPISVAPAPKVVANPQFGAVTVAPGAFEVGFTPDPLGAGDYLVIEATAVKSAGVNFVSRSSFKQVFVAPAAAVSPADILAEYDAIFGSGSLQTGSKVFLRMRIVDRTTGIASDSIQNSFVIA